MSNVSLLTNGVGDINGGGLLMPTGTVLAFAGTVAPSGWLICDGTAYSQTDYATLFSALSSTYNTQVNPTTGSAWAAPSAGQFRVPDLRGLFLRGQTSGASVGGNVIGVGAHQEDAMQGHRHNVNAPSAPTGGTLNFFSAAGTVGSGAGGPLIGTATALQNDGSNGNPRTAAESRPMNRGVTYIIKI